MEKLKKLKQPEIFYTEQIGINAKFFGKKPAVVCGDERQSWKDFHRRTNMVANALLGLGYSDKEAQGAVKALPEGLSVSEGIRQALKLLARA